MYFELAQLVLSLVFLCGQVIPGIIIYENSFFPIKEKSGAELS